MVLQLPATLAHEPINWVAIMSGVVRKVYHKYKPGYYLSDPGTIYFKAEWGP